MSELTEGQVKEHLRSISESQQSELYFAYRDAVLAHDAALRARLADVEAELAASQARCREMEEKRVSDFMRKRAFEELQKQVAVSTQLQTTLAAREARIVELEDWQKIVIGSGTDQETVIRMAASEYTKTAVQCWKDRTKKIEAERDAAVQEMITRDITKEVL